MTGSDSIQFLSLQKNFGSRIIFRHLSGEIKPGEFITFLGPSGCGKSTFLRILGGLETVTLGTLRVPVSFQTSFVFQEPRLLPWRTCLENTELPLEIRGQKNVFSRQKALSLLKLLRLEDALGLFPHQLSGGMKMRAAIARSLILDPRFLLMDEPFSALDEEIRSELQLELRSLQQKNKWTLAFVTHQLEEALFLSDRIFVFQKQGNGLLEWAPQLPGIRTSELRNTAAFFEELRRLKIFMLEAR